jgi:preprotein translocase subunit SecD
MPMPLADGAGNFTPGIAGFVITLFTAVDANVLINERILKNALARGDRRGRDRLQGSGRAIHDANATNFIAALFAFGSVKGFAVVLMIACSPGVHRVTLTRPLVAGYAQDAPQ